MTKTINRFFILLASVALLISAYVAPAYAAGNVSYEGEAAGFIFSPGSGSSATDLFENFKAVIPGDELTDSVEVRNNSGRTVRIYMKALGAEPGSEDFLNQMGLVVKKGDAEIFNSQADKTAQLTDWVLLGEYAAGDKQLLDMSLSVPIEMNDDYQNAIGYLNWVFKVEEVDEPTPGDEPTPTPGDTPTPSDTPTPDSPGTGDNAHIAFYAILLAGAAGTALALRRKKQQ